MNLTQLTLEALDIERMVNENEGQLDPFLESLFDANQELTARKIDGYAVTIDRLKSSAQFYRDRAEELYHKARANEKTVDYLRARIKDYLIATNAKSVSGNLAKFAILRSNPKLNIDMDLLPEEFKVTETFTVPNKDLIKATLEQSSNIAGASYEEVYSLRQSIGEPTK